MSALFHLAGNMLRPGSIVEPGNWGRVIRAVGAQHPQWTQEQAVEAARANGHPHKPSRLEAAFASVDLAEAEAFRKRIPGFSHHVLYRVSLVQPDAPSHLTDSRLAKHQGNQQYEWADLYWQDYNPEKITIPGIGTLAFATSGVPCREFVTLSALKIEEVVS